MFGFDVVQKIGKADTLSLDIVYNLDKAKINNITKVAYLPNRRSPA